MDGFAWWILGYQKFLEPIIRGCISEECGWTDITEEVRVPSGIQIVEDLERVGHSLSTSACEKLFERARQCYGNQKRRISLDAAFESTDGILIGEFKCWGGFQVLPTAALKAKLSQGMMFPERLAIPHVIHNQLRRPVMGFVVATVLPADETHGQFTIGGDEGIKIHLFSIRHLVRDHANNVMEQLKSLDKLDRAVADVKDFLMCGPK